MSSPQLNDMLTIEDLARRWDVSTSTAWSIVRDLSVPYVSLVGSKANLNGKGPRLVKFRAESIDLWEKGREGVWADPEVKPTESAQPVAKLKTTASERLGYNLPPRTGH